MEGSFTHLSLDVISIGISLIFSILSFFFSMQALSHRKAKTESSIADMIIGQKNKIFDTLISVTEDENKTLLKKKVAIEYSHLFYIYNFACYQYFLGLLKKKDFDNLYKEDIEDDIKMVIKNYSNIKLDDYKYLKKYLLQTSENNFFQNLLKCDNKIVLIVLILVFALVLGTSIKH